MGGGGASVLPTTSIIAHMHMHVTAAFFSLSARAPEPPPPPAAASICVSVSVSVSVGHCSEEQHGRSVCVLRRDRRRGRRKVEKPHQEERKGKVHE